MTQAVSAASHTLDKRSYKTSSLLEESQLELSGKRIGESLSSCLYHCKLQHRRLHPRVSAFSYQIFMFWLDLDEIEDLQARSQIFGKIKTFGVNERALFSLWDDDFLPGDSVDNSLLDKDSMSKSTSGSAIKAKVQARLAKKGLQAEKIYMLAHLRAWGYLFNPATFYFCTREDGTPVACLVEITNTFHERKVFLSSDFKLGRFYDIIKKEFYISPFNYVGDDLEFHLSVPKDRLRIMIHTLKDDVYQMLATLRGRREGEALLRPWRLVRVYLGYPLLTVRIMVSIYVQAAWLWVRRVPYFKKAARLDLQRDFWRRDDECK